MSGAAEKVKGYRVLLADARYWVGHGTYPAVEIAVRLHHRLVKIHPLRYIAALQQADGGDIAPLVAFAAGPP
jgi:hypothetical protein